MISASERRPRPWALAVAVALAAIVIWRLEHWRAAARVRRAVAAETARSDEPAHPHRDGLGARSRGAITRSLRPRAHDLRRVSGRVLDPTTDLGVANVEVVFGNGPPLLRTTTDDDGQYVIDVPPGRYQPSVRGATVVSLARIPRGRSPGLPPSAGPGPRVPSPTVPLDVFTDLTGVDLEVSAAVKVHGTVRDQAGAPIAGATVVANLEDDAYVEPVLGTNVARTERDGTYRLVLPAAAHLVNVFDGDHVATEIERVELAGAGDDLELDLTMTRGCIISGRVTGTLTSDGGEIDRFAGTESTGQASRATEFGADGAFTYGTADEATFLLAAWPLRGPASTEQRFECRAGTRIPNVTFEVPATAPDLTGTIVTATGQPSARAFVDVTAVDGAPAQRERADGASAWAIFELPPEPYRVVARVPGEGIAVAVVTAPARDVVLTLSGTGALAGTTIGLTEGSFTMEVDCLPKGQTYPLPGASVERFLVPVRGGTYRVDRLPACGLWLVGRKGPMSTPEFEVEVAADRTATLDLDLTPLVTTAVTGTVHDRAGRPIGGALVTVAGQRMVRTLTERDGGFALPAPPGGRLIVSGDGAMGSVAVPADDRPAWEVDVVLDRTPRAPP